MDSATDYLLTLPAVRERANKVFELAEKNGLNHFQYHADKMPDAAEFVIGVISVRSLP